MMRLPLPPHHHWFSVGPFSYFPPVTHFPTSLSTDSWSRFGGSVPVTALVAFSAMVVFVGWHNFDGGVVFSDCVGCSDSCCSCWLVNFGW